MSTRATPLVTVLLYVRHQHGRVDAEQCRGFAGSRPHRTLVERHRINVWKCSQRLKRLHEPGARGKGQVGALSRVLHDCRNAQLLGKDKKKHSRLQ